jgi:hypothetical protein
MADPFLWFCWYLCCCAYTLALTASWTTKIKHMRAAALWPVFWLAVAANRLVSRGRANG